MKKQKKTNENVIGEYGGNALQLQLHLLQSELLDFNHDVHFVHVRNGFTSGSDIYSVQQCIETVPQLIDLQRESEGISRIRMRFENREKKSSKLTMAKSSGVSSTSKW